MTLKSKEQRITELTNEVNELATKTITIQTPTSAPRSNSSVSTTPIRRTDSADERNYKINKRGISVSIVLFFTKIVNDCTEENTLNYLQK